jgi:hypothetical protein
MTVIWLISTDTARKHDAFATEHEKERKGKRSTAVNVNAR